MKIKQAIILVGGKGIRLKPYTLVLPKPLMPIGDYPILEIIIMQLKKMKFNHIILAVGYKASLIKSYFGNGKRYGLKIDYINEKKPLGTIGPLNLVKKLQKNFIILNGDTLTNLNFKKFMDSHIKNKSNFTIASFKRSHQIEFGVIETKDNKLIQFDEKPRKTFQVCMGVYAANKSIIKEIPKNRLYGFDDLMTRMLKQKNEINIFNHNGLWFDIGRQNDYFNAIDFFKANKKKFLT
jgi:NDP-sugar pyrophosphorylase family protein